MTAPAARQLGLPPSAEEMLADAREVIRLLVDELLTFKSAGSPHKALRSPYSPRGVCQTARGGCSPICTAWVAAIDVGAGWMDAYDKHKESEDGEGRNATGPRRGSRQDAEPLTLDHLRNGRRRRTQARQVRPVRANPGG